MLDTYLALAPYGLLLAQRLSSELDLWLVRELWQILDNTQYYLSEPDRLRPPAAGATTPRLASREDARSLRDTLTQWEMARTETDLAGLRVYWIGDALSESLLPSRVDPHLVARFETLAKSLDKRIQRPPGGQTDVFADCVRDAVALTAALMPYRAFILTAHATGNGSTPDEPSLCSHLRHWGLRCYRLGVGAKTQLEKEFILPMFARAGVAELMWAGLKLAVVHILAPKAVVVPHGTNHNETFPPELESPGESDVPETDWWDEAVSFWYSLSADDDDRKR